MRVTQLDTLRLDAYPNLLFVELRTDEGLVGLGETFFGAQAVEAYLHETVAPYLLGADASRIETHHAALKGYLGSASAGVEMRGNSAVDIALWDLAGQASGLPLSELMGGASRDSVRIYNTCAGYRYVRSQSGVAMSNWGLPDAGPEGPYEDLDAFLHHADELAQSLLADGITAMKIWPFDLYVPSYGGHHIDERDLQAGLEPFRKIRAAVGADIDVMVEFHGLWDVPTAVRIARALEEFDPFWLEDPVRVENLDALARFNDASATQVAAGETLAGVYAYQDLLERGAADVIMLDVGWAGGVSAARRVAAMAEARELTVAFHDCTGPVVLTASTHLSLSLPNAVLQETVRAYYTGWYRELVTELPSIEAGRIRPPSGHGLGTALLPDLRERPGTRVRSTEASDLAPAHVGG